MPTSIRTLALAGAVALLPAALSAQTLVGRADSVYTWRGTLAAGRMLRVQNFNGPIEVHASQGNAAEVRAEKRTRGGAITDVAFDVETASNGDVRICAVQRGDDGCDDDHRWSHNDDGWGRHVTVAMSVLVPRGTLLEVATGNGTVLVDGVGADVKASTGNGRVNVRATEGPVRVSTGNGDVEIIEAKGPVRVSTGNGRVTVSTSEGPVEAHSGNGDIDVRMSGLRAKDDMKFSTGSGSVRVTLPSNYNGELDARTGNGEVVSDFDLKLNGRMDPRHVRATIGDGGARLQLTSGNGRLELRKSR